MADGCRLGKINKSPYISNGLPIAAKFGTVMHIDHIDPPAP